jgi:hypothetical protein
LLRRAQVLDPSTADRHTAPLFGKAQRYAPSDSSAAACDDRRLALEVQVHGERYLNRQTIASARGF